MAKNARVCCGVAALLFLSAGAFGDESVAGAIGKNPVRVAAGGKTVARRGETPWAMTSTGNADNTERHLHPFLSPDGRAAFFNSAERGILQACMVRGF